MKKLVLFSGFVVGISLNTLQATPDLLAGICDSQNPPPLCAEVIVSQEIKQDTNKNITNNTNISPDIDKSTVAISQNIREQIRQSLPKIGNVNFTFPTIKMNQVTPLLPKINIDPAKLSSVPLNPLNKTSYSTESNSWENNINFQ